MIGKRPCGCSLPLFARALHRHAHIQGNDASAQSYPWLLDEEMKRRACQKEKKKRSSSKYTLVCTI